MTMDLAMTIKFENAFNYVIVHEGGLEENSADPGGITKYGISLRFLRSISSDKLKDYEIYVGDLIDADDITHLTLDQAKAIYFGEFWCKAPFDRINRQEVVSYIFDMAVNMGISPAIKCAQRAGWAVIKNKEGILEDGILNAGTIEMINSCEFFIVPAMRSERASTYKLIAERNPKEREFLPNWLKRSYNS